MNALKRWCEEIFGSIAGWAYSHKWLSICIVLLLFVPLVLQLPQLSIDTSNESFFKPDDPALINYNEFRNQFGKDEFIVVAISAPEVFDLGFLDRLRNLHNDIASKVPYLDEITSLVNVRNTRGEEGELIVEDFLAQWPASKEDLDILRKRAQENTLYENYIINAQGTFTSIIIKPLACNPDSIVLRQDEGTCLPMSNVQNREMISAVYGAAEQYRAGDFEIYVSGLPAVIEYLNLTLEKDLAIIIPASFVIVILFLGFLFKRITGVVYPVFIVGLALLSALGVQALFGIPMTNITAILPSFVLVISISDSVHILALFYPAFQRTGSRKQAIVEAMRHSGLPVLMTSLTTAGGLASFMAAEVAPIADLGMVTPVAVALALVYTVLLLPALLSLFPVKRKHFVAAQTSALDRIFDKIVSVSCSRQKAVIAVFAGLFLLALAGILQLRFEHNALQWFPRDSRIRMATEKIDDEMKGTVSLDVLIDTGKPDGLYEPEFINGLESAAIKYSRYHEDTLFVGKVLSLATVLKETNRALHGNDRQKYVIPDNRQLIAQELFLFQMSGSDDLEELVDQQFSKTRFTMHVPYRDTSKYKRLVEDVKAEMSGLFPGCNVVATGVNALFVEILNNVMRTMLKSYTIALLLISVLMVIMLGKLRMGMLSMIPNLFPIIMVMGIMGWFGIPLDFGTILIGSITIGLVVDDTIHFLHNFGKYYDRHGDPAKAAWNTLHTVGRAMVVTSFVLAGGFLCDLLSELTLNKYTGTLIALTILIALAADFLLAPAILSLVYRKKTQSGEMVQS